MSIPLTDPVMLVYSCILAAAFGAVFGSFINCTAWRIAHGENFLKGRSHCAECGHALSAADLVPVFSYLFLRGKCRYCGKKISPRYMLTELLLAAAFVCFVLRFGISGETLRYMGLAVILFFLIYIVIPIMGNGSAADMKLVQFVGEHIVHYFTSGTMGWSFDIDQNMPDRKDFEYIVAPFVNIARAIKGEELVSVVNRFYWCTGTDITTLTNVRTFFGTLYIYSDAWQFITYTLFLSTFIYAWKVATILRRSVYLDIILFYYCGLLMMGWFEFYFFHLDTIEIPLITLFYGWLARQERGMRNVQRSMFNE